MSDFVMMSNLMHTRPEKDILFRDVQVRTLPDSNKTSYSSGQLNFKTNNASQEYWSLSKTDLLFPFTVNVSGVLSATNCLGTVTGTTSVSAAPATVGANGLAVGVASSTGGVLTLGSRGSIAPKLWTGDIIQGVSIALNNGGTGLVSDLKDISLVNDIRLLVQNNLDWANNNAAQLCFAKNQGIDLTNNYGFNQRQQYLYNLSNCTYYAAAGTAAGSNQTAYISRIDCVVAIPLAMIHSFFANCDFPSRGIEYEINFFLCREFNGNNQNCGFDVVTAAPASIVWTAGSAYVGEINYTSSMLKYDAYVFQPHFQKQVDELMLSGKLAKRYIKFAATQVYDDLINKAGDVTSYQVANGIVKPIRAWILGYPTRSTQISSSSKSD